MAVVIGNSTTATFDGSSNYCILNANWGYNPGPQRLYCLGSWTPYRTYYKPSETLSLTIYSPGPSYSTDPSEGCGDEETIEATVDPGICDEDVAGVSGDWLVTSYSYTKSDTGMPGQETWSLQRWTGLSATTPGEYVTEPSFTIRLIAEGSASTPNISGITFTGDTTTSYQGSVGANAIGNADTMIGGVVASVGGGSSASGDIGQGSASIPYQQLYI
jgi:hypothetical protein